jgi:hypothetical protein
MLNGDVGVWAPWKGLDDVPCDMRSLNSTTRRKYFFLFAFRPWIRSARGSFLKVLNYLTSLSRRVGIHGISGGEAKVYLFGGYSTGWRSTRRDGLLQQI